MSQFAWTFPGGKLKQEVTSVVLVNTTIKIVDVTVPAGKMWMLLKIKVANGDDVNRDIYIHIYKEAGKTNLLDMLIDTRQAAAGGGYVVWPNNYAGVAWTEGHGSERPILVAGNTIQITWSDPGASTGATDADGLVICYLEIDAP